MATSLLLSGGTHNNTSLIGNEKPSLEEEEADLSDKSPHSANYRLQITSMRKSNRAELERVMRPFWIRDRLHYSLENKSASTE